MNSKERVVATLTFKQPDRLPVDLWVHRATYLKYSLKLSSLLTHYELDIVRIFGPMDRAFYPEMTNVGEFQDVWGSTWQVLQEGMVGEVKKPALQDISKINEYKVPIDLIKSEWEKHNDLIDKKIQENRKKGKFILGGDVEIFQRMQFVRGTENLFCDLAEGTKDVFIFRDKITEYFKEYLQYWLNKDVDGIMFFDDWGSQRALLISPDMWRKFFKPVYKEMMDMIKKAGKYVFFHTDGYILDLYPEFIELGVDAINSQLWCMGIEKVAEKFAGKITFWGEIDRQNILAFGTPEDIDNAAKRMKDCLYVNGGGLIGQSVAGKDVPLENIEALLNCWNK
jgi:uroporphyrinogen decarboxylase